MNDRRYLLEEGASATISTVRQVGMLALLHNGLTDVENAKVATEAIADLDRKNLDLTTLLTTSLAYDSSWESITYDVLGREGLGTGTLTRTIRYKDFGNGRRPDQVTHGPLVPMAKAAALLAVLNG